MDGIDSKSIWMYIPFNIWLTKNMGLHEDDIDYCDVKDCNKKSDVTIFVESHYGGTTTNYCKEHYKNVIEYMQI